MKLQASWLLIPVVALCLGACKKKEAAKAPETPVAVAEAPAPEAPLPVPAVTPDERAAKLGFVKHLMQDTEGVLAFYDGQKTASRAKATKLWKLVENQLGMGGDEPAEDESAEATGPAALFGTEFTLALGKSTAEQAGNLLTFNRRMGYFQMRTIAKAFAAAVKSGDACSLGDSFADSYGPDLFKDLLKDPQSGISLLEKTQMPPVYMAFKTKEADRATAAQQLAAMIANANMLGEMVAPVEIESGGCKFEGVKILGAQISATMAEDRASMDEELDSASVDQLLAAVAKKDLLILSGTVGDYVVLFLGGSAADLKLAGDVGQSLAASDALAFSDAYVSKELAAVVYGQEAAMDTLASAAGGLAEMTNGLRDGLAGADGLGDTRDLEAMFKIVAEREAALRKLAGNDSLGMVAFCEDGLKIESYGGTDNGMVDWKSPNKLAALGDSEEVVLFANLTTAAVYDEKARAYAEALLETAYAMAMRVAEAPIKGGQFEEFQQMAKLFDGKFRPDLLALWDAYSNNFGGSLGHEGALVVDLKGSAPAIPGLPQAVVDTAKVPRVSLVAPVTDRAKLGASWDKMNTTLTGTLAKISEMTGQKIPMQKPISSEKNGNTTWFFPLPFFNDDFLPSVTVGDKWFAVSSSKNQALDLIAKAGADGQTRHGFYMSLNFKALESYSQDTFKLVDQNAEAVTGAALPGDRKKLIQDAIAVLGDLDKLTVHSRREGAVLRSSIHFKTR
jgi:Fe-S cluster assembly iron-binding protein IscA